ncbi:MAG: hypothetical protein H0W72_12640, partial [Planctomycetes bacterium]|nr:hypothetical protein [Planctomycetota bacterium]
MLVGRLLPLLFLTVLLGAVEEVPVVGAPAEAPVAPVAAAPAAAPAGLAARIVLDGMIDEQKARYYRRALRQAVEAGVSTVVVHLTTDGGHLDAGLDILSAALAVRSDHPDRHPKLVAYIDNKAWSAGAMIAYGHQEIYMSGVAHIGDVGIIMIGADGQIEYAPEKIESPVRAHLRTVAAANGWDTAKLVKMTAREQELYRFAMPDGARYVIEDDLGRFLSEHPELKREQAVLILGKDRLLSYTAREAVADGMATAIVRDPAELYAKLGIDPARMLDLAPTSVERVSWSIAGFASVLASLAVFFIILELKSPGVGLWAVLAGICGAGFFICQYYQDLAGNLELVLVVLGAVAIAVELFALPTGGLLAIGGGMAMFSGLLLAFMPNELQFEWSSEGWAAALRSALSQAALSLAVLTVALAWLIRVLPQLKAVDRIAATAEITATSAGAREITAAGIVGRTGTARTDLRPAGLVLVEGEELSAIAENGVYI